MASYSVLFLSVMYLTTVKAQTFCQSYTAMNVSCFSAPSDCRTTDDCEMTMVAVDNNSTFTITLTGRSDGWIAFGLSGDQEMGRDDVSMCIYNGSNVTLQHRYNQPNSKNNVQGTDLGDDLLLLQQSFVQGIISCEFNRTKSIDGVPDAFGFVGRTYYGLFGRGPVTNGEPRIHQMFPWVSDSQIDLASGELIGISRRGGDPSLTDSPDDTGESTTPMPSMGVKVSPSSIVGMLLLLLVCFRLS